MRLSVVLIVSLLISSNVFAKEVDCTRIKASMVEKTQCQLSRYVGVPVRRADAHRYVDQLTRCAPGYHVNIQFDGRTYFVPCVQKASIAVVKSYPAVRKISKPYIKKGD